MARAGSTPSSTESFWLTQIQIQIQTLLQTPLWMTHRLLQQMILLQTILPKIHQQIRWNLQSLRNLLLRTGETNESPRSLPGSGSMRNQEGQPLQSFLPPKPLRLIRQNWTG